MNVTLKPFRDLALAGLIGFAVMAGAVNGQDVAKSYQVGSNPILPAWMADPSVLQVGDTFYLYATSDIDAGLSANGNPVVWMSKDFVNWSFEGCAYRGHDWNKVMLWAPSKPIVKNGIYHIYASVDQRTTLATSTSPGGPFTFEPAPIIGDIDGQAYLDDDGKAYIFWRQRQAARLTDDLKALQPGTAITIKTKREGYSEGPVMFKRKGIYYYVYTLSGGGNYMNAYMMSAVSPLGPFTAPADDIIARTNATQCIWGPGHGDVFHVNDTDQYYLVYLEYGDGGSTRQVFADKLEFNADGTIQRVNLTWKGAGRLTAPGAPDKAPQPVNLALGALTSASSTRGPRGVGTNIAANPDADMNPDAPLVPGISLSRQTTYQPSCAVDGSNRTSWHAADNHPNHWMQIDLHKEQDIVHCQLFFTLPTQGHAFKLEKSLDSVDWTVCHNSPDVAIRTPHVVENIGKARFLKVTILSGDPGLWEFKVYAAPARSKFK